MSTYERYDLVILGSGSTAFGAALHAAELGKAVAMTEYRTVGGTCANRGCLPSKNLIEAARIVYEAAHPRYPGLSPVQMSVTWADLIAQKDEIIHEYRAHKYESLLDHPERIQVVPGQATFVSDHEIEVQSTAGTRRLGGDQILIATGSVPEIPALAGLTDVPYLTSDLLSSADHPGRRLHCPRTGPDVCALWNPGHARHAGQAHSVGRRARNRRGAHRDLAGGRAPYRDIGTGTWGRACRRGSNALCSASWQPSDVHRRKTRDRDGAPSQHASAGIGAGGRNY